MEGTNHFDLSGKPITRDIVIQAYAAAWLGNRHPTTIQAERRTLLAVLSVLDWQIREKRPFKFNGAYLIENPAIPEGEVLFDVMGHHEQNAKISGIAVADVHGWWVTEPDPMDELQPHAVFIAESAWNELWNALPPSARCRDDAETDRMGILLRSARGRRLSIQQSLPSAQIKAVS